MFKKSSVLGVPTIFEEGTLSHDLTSELDCSSVSIFEYGDFIKNYDDLYRRNERDAVMFSDSLMEELADSRGKSSADKKDGGTHADIRQEVKGELRQCGVELLANRRRLEDVLVEMAPNLSQLKEDLDNMHDIDPNIYPKLHEQLLEVIYLNLANVYLDTFTLSVEESLIN